MGNIIKEDTFPVFKEIKNKEINDYILSESSDVKSIVNQLEIIGSMSYNKDKKIFKINEGSRILSVYLEDYITRDIDNYLLNL